MDLGSGSLIEWLVGAAVWAVANFVYLDRKRRGLRGASRFLGFWFGTPTTWVTFFMVPEGSVDSLERPPDDEAALFREVRHDRKLRALQGGQEEPGSAPSEN